MSQFVMFWSVVVASLIVGLDVSAQEKGVAQDPKMAEMMKKWMDAATPGDAHKKLGDLVGSWDLTTSMYMGGPGSEPTISKGSAEIKWIMGGRFLSEDMKGEMMGMPMTGLMITGYDNLNKKYVSFWIDNTATGMYTAGGHFNQDGTVLSLYGTSDEPMTGEHDKNVKYVTRFISKDRFIHEIHDLAIGEPNTLVVSIVYERKK